MKKLKTIFIQDWGTYNNHTIVCVGYNFDEFFDKISKNKDKDIVDFIKKQSDYIKENWKDYCFMYFPKEYSFLLLKEFKDEWYYYEILIHETHHLVYLELDEKGMLDELEAQAYQQQYLFGEIRETLQGKYRKFKKTTSKKKLS